MKTKTRAVAQVKILSYSIKIKVMTFFMCDFF